LLWAIIMASLQDFNRVDGTDKLAPHSAVRWSAEAIVPRATSRKRRNRTASQLGKG